MLSVATSGSRNLVKIKALRAVFVFVRRRRAARTKRPLEDWIALTIARGLSLAIISGLIYAIYTVEMTSFDEYRKCNKNSTVTRFEWVLGFRPMDDCTGR